MIGWLVEALLASALLMALVLALRAPVRRVFGAQVAYALWAIPAARLLLPPLPASWRGEAAAPIASVGRSAVALIAPDAMATLPVALPAATQPETGGVIALLPLLWAAGAAGFVLWQVARYALFRRRVLRAAGEGERIGSIRIVESDGADGPLAFGVIDRVVAFPRGFADLYDGRERELALAHELGHHARGDLIANWAALAVLALHWFNPLAWAAFRAFRADQEMANDAGVLARCGREARHAYGCAIVKAAHGHALSPACHLHSVKDLKGRLTMLGREAISRPRAVAGAALAGVIGIGMLGLTASGTQAAQRVRDRVEQATGVDLAALDAVAAFQAATPETPPAPGTPPAASASATSSDGHNQSVTTTDTDGRRHVVIVRDGKTTTYEGKEADAWIAANPPPMPPAPPAPPALPAAPGGTTNTTRSVVAVRTMRDGVVSSATVTPPDVIERNCVDGADGPAAQTVVQRIEGGHQTMTICTNRIEKMASDAAARGVAAARAGETAAKASRDAMRTALASLERSRASLAATRGLTAEQRREALAGLDEAIKEMKAEAAGRD